MLISFLKNEFLWTKHGVHDLDENKHAKTVEDTVIIEFDDPNVYTRVCEIVVLTRINKFDSFFEQDIVMLWVLEQSTPTIYTKYTLLEEKQKELFENSNDLVLGG